MKVSHETLEMLTAVAEKLYPILDDFVFVGGSTTGFFITDPLVEMPRPTLDVDVIIEILSATAYHQLEDRLRQLGLINDMDSNITCRWKLNDILVDVMPTDPSLLGFSNNWYPDAIKFSKKTKLKENLEINMVTAPYFLATKIEAFYGRGNNDFLCSKDIQDIISIIEGRVEVKKEINDSPTNLKKFISENFTKLLTIREFRDYLPGHISHDENTDARAKIVIRKFEEIANLQY